jgi:guanylate kinase
VLLEIELQGVRQVRERLPQAQLVFLAPPSWEDLVARLNGRGTEDPAVVEHRLATAREEMAAKGEFHTVVVNSTVESAGRALIDLLETHAK